MRELDFAEVRAAGLPAIVELAQVTYEYRPLPDEVAVYLAPARRPYMGTTHRMPETGWVHRQGCVCPYCRTRVQALP